MENKTLSNLISRIDKEAGLEVFLVNYTKEFNDWPLEGTKYKESYIKAIKNTIINQNSELIFGSCIYDQIFDKIHNHEAYNSSRIENVVFHGIFPIYLTTRTPKTRVVEKNIFWGLGGTKQVTEHYTQIDSTPGGPLRMMPLTTYKESEDISYFAQMDIKPRDEVGYGRGQIPKLTIIANQELIASTISYLKENPNEYISFLNSILPAKEFPNVNKGIIGRAKQKNGLQFIPLKFRDDLPGFYLSNH